MKKITGSSTPTGTSSSTPAEITSKAVSGAVTGVKGQGDAGVWIFLAALLGLGAWAL
jgi:hypothetical protein